MVQDSCHIKNDEGVDNIQSDQEKFTSQQLSAKINENSDYIETSNNFLMTCLKETLVKIFCPKCYVYPFLAVVIVVVTVVLIGQYTKRDEMHIAPIFIKDYSDTNATPAAVPTNASIVSLPPSESPSST